MCSQGCLASYYTEKITTYLKRTSLCSHFQIRQLPAVYLATLSSLLNINESSVQLSKAIPSLMPQIPPPLSTPLSSLASPTVLAQLNDSYHRILKKQKENFSTFLSTTNPFLPHFYSLEFIPIRLSPLLSTEINLIKVTTHLHTVTPMGRFLVGILLGLSTGFAEVRPFHPP